MSSSINKIKFNFPEGILGFEEEREFFIYDSNYVPFYVMESTNGKLKFLLTSPYIFLESYSPTFYYNEWEEIEVFNEKDKLILCIVNFFGEDYKDMTANLRAPIIINKNKLLAKQAVCTDEKYSLQHKVFKE